MSRQCAVCAHPERQAIDREIVAGELKAVISRRWGLVPDATERHAKHGHVVRHERMLAGKEVLEPRQGDDLLAKLEELTQIVRALMGRCVQSSQYIISLACARELVRIYELVGKLTGQLDATTRVNIAVVQQQQRVAEQELMLERLTISERFELRRLIAKAQGEPEAPGSAVSVVTNGTVEGEAHGAAQSEPRSD